MQPLTLGESGAQEDLEQRCTLGNFAFGFNGYTDGLRIGQSLMQITLRANLKRIF